MRLLPSSIWIWFTIVSIFLSISQQNVAGCDEAFKEALLSDFREILDSKMEHVDHRFDNTDRAMGRIMNELELVTGTVQAIEGEVSAITGRSSETQLNMRDVKLMQENMKDERLTLRDKIDYFNVSMIEIRSLNNDTFEELQSIGNETLELLQDVTQYLDDMKNSSSIIEENKEELGILRTETTQLFQNVSQDLQVMSDESKTLLRSLGQNLIAMGNETKELLKDIEQDTEILHNSSNNIITKIVTLGEDINEVKLTNENNTEKVTENFKSEIVGLSTKFNSIEDKISSFGDIEDKIKQDITLSDSNIINSMRKELKIVTDPLTTVLSEQSSNTFKITSKLDIVETLIRCPTGFFKVGASGQCFSYYNDKLRNYTDAKSKCAAVGAVLAKPFEPLALQSYIVMRYGSYSGFAWVGARGSGVYVKWDRDGTTLETNFPIWWKGDPGSKIATSHCMTLMVYGGHMKDHPGKTYWMGPCHDTRYTVCELL